MQQDLSNARIIEWESTEERGFEFTCLVEVAHVARREARGATFREGGTYYTEQQAAELGARVVAEFPAPSLAEIVGNAPAFRVNREGGWPDFYYRHGDKWVRCGAEGVLYSWEQLNSMVGLDLSTVVPLYPREVVS